MYNSRDPVVASNHAVSSGHELASRAALDMLEAGGNAVDAGVAAGITLGVVHCELVNVAGVAPIILKMADSSKVITIDGLGTWPAAASAEFFAREYDGEMPEGILRTVVPAAPASWITALDEFGTMTFSEVSAPAIRAARDGFPTFERLAEFLQNNEEQYRRYRSNAEIYLSAGRPPRVGELFVQRDLADSLSYMADQEKAATGNRSTGLRAAYDAFYRGDIAKTITAYHADNGGFLTLEDMASYRVRFEQPVAVQFSGVDFYCCGPWCQGISLAQALAALDQVDLDVHQHNSTAYIHELTELYKLVFADRERWVADPAFTKIPMVQMLGQEYLAKRLDLIDKAKAYPQMPPAGDPFAGLASVPDSLKHRTHNIEGGDGHATKPQQRHPVGGPPSADTSHVCVIDKHGNMFAATPSDTSNDTEVIPGTGLCASSRGSQSRGIVGHINAVAPGKRPRLTPNPALALKDGKPFMTLGTPGGDVQIQAMTQVIANKMKFGMNIQQAIEAPRFATYSYPSSFAPNDYFPGLLMIEKRIDDATGKGLDALGHKVDWWPDWTWKAGGVCSITVDEKTGTLEAGADPRRASMALGG